MNKMLLGRYIQSDSWVHQLDPRTKLLASFYFIFLVFIVNSWIGYLLLMLFVLWAVNLSKISFIFFLNGVKPMIGLILFTTLFQVFFTSTGDVYWKWGILAITSDGIVNGIFIFLRLVLIILMSTLLTLTTSPIELTDGIEYLLKPASKLGFPSHEFALMLSIALRYVPTLMDEAYKIMNAQRSRGVEFNEGSFMQRIKAIIPILIPLFVSAFNRADDMANAMEARGYRGGDGRTKYRQLKFGINDGKVCGVLLCISFCVVSIRLLS